MDRKLAVRPLVACLVLSLVAGCATSTQDTAEMANASAAASASAEDGAASASASSSMVSNATGAALDEVLAGSWRTPKWVARDQYRHPKETLSFFLLKPDQTVVEITPGGGWYTEILAPYLRENGHYVAAVWDDKITGQPGYRYDLNKQLRAKIAADAAHYDKAEVRIFDAKKPDFGAPNSADVVLTFRNAHNWVEDGNAEDYFHAFFAVLKPGGTLGFVDHRAKPGTDLQAQIKSGYLTEELVKKYAADAGFVLDGESEVNANPKDTTDHPNGVWTLPPSNQHEKADDAKYQAIGESDRMTLRFKKPAG
ncbi:Methyltransferase precursor pretein [Lysobacter dokdonensis DS-58]|uniref:Methyltransferase pretein n=1 Tax=Lysobacter dokdonensis DS-58 TaxID=1300345 RepID=A0A0A2WI56_9GAMM|nr:class I SAM-dependent methyltransferase [Lysobacter dokdonensis]KGQ18392.1 Methyltransferase precursor pretein [Lysobacter dokdonensis DS-58]